MCSLSTYPSRVRIVETDVKERLHTALRSIFCGSIRRIEESRHVVLVIRQQQRTYTLLKGTSYIHLAVSESWFAGCFLCYCLWLKRRYFWVQNPLRFLWFLAFFKWAGKIPTQCIDCNRNAANCLVKRDWRSPSWIRRRQNATKKNRCWFHTTPQKIVELLAEVVNPTIMFLRWICHQRALDVQEQGTIKLESADS